jgi:hypothetical protein
LCLRGLSEIFIKFWHVDVIHEVDQSLAWLWSVVVSGQFVDLTLNDYLQSLGVSVGVHGD